MSELENKEIINTNNLSTRYGMIAGLIMSIFLVAFQASGNDFSPFYKLANYIILGITVVIALNVLNQKTPGDVFVKGVGTGTSLSLVAGLALVIINYLLFFIFPELSFSKYSIEPTNLKQVTMVSAVLFFETLVFGSLITFATVQYLKR